LPIKRTIIYWRAVAIAGGVALLAVGALVLTIWIVGRPASAAAQADEEPVAVESKTEAKLVAPVQREEPRPREEAAVKLPAVPKSEPRPDAQDTPDDALLGASPAGACETYGTSVHFLNNPSEAARKARRHDKLVFLLHVSGNFEDAKFT
jgi:hypothetical protein